ncbi:ATP-binding protein [Streptomyces virginiae]|uniref:ATP-binding protein n=1 Tax=Streptomyces virginiae TaxID=1961 RepID=UPI00365662CF
MDRATSTGGRPPDAPPHDQVAEICARLDGTALAIELAAARYPTLGPDGITAALAHPLRMLTGGSRAQDRHRSVRAALDWSHNLLDPADRTLLRRVSVFVTPFTAPAAEVTGLDTAAAVDGLARLAEQSLLTVTFSPDGTRYRALETLRQYGGDRLTEAGELHDTHARHLSWCLARSTELAAPRADWRARFDQTADELRAALAWAQSRPEQRADAYRLARAMAELAFTRHLVAESQQRYEQAAALATTRPTRRRCTGRPRPRPPAGCTAMTCTAWAVRRRTSHVERATPPRPPAIWRPPPATRTASPASSPARSRRRRPRRSSPRHGNRPVPIRPPGPRSRWSRPDGPSPTRTLILAGGDHAVRGTSALADLGLAPRILR